MPQKQTGKCSKPCRLIWVTAPFSGVITERNVHPGALVSAEAKDSKPMLELKEIELPAGGGYSGKYIGDVESKRYDIILYQRISRKKNDGAYQPEIDECKCTVPIRTGGSRCDQ